MQLFALDVSRVVSFFRLRWWVFKLLEKKDIFAIHTHTGGEKILREYMLAVLSDVGSKDIFIPQRVLYNRIKGSWHKDIGTLFPGYVFIRCRNAESVYYELKNIPKMSNLLHDGDYNFVPLKQQEQKFLEIICKLSLREIRRDGCINFILPGSNVVIIPSYKVQSGDVIITKHDSDEVIKVVSGPLQLLAPYVKKINFNKRRVILDAQMFGLHTLHIGIRLPKDKEIN